METWKNEEKGMPPFEPIQVDRDGCEWVVLQGYDIRKENDDIEKEQIRERFLYYNTCLVDLENKSVFAEWARTANFYGRWMPESTGSIDYLWNDYPWANSYKSSLYEDGYVEREIPCDVELTYEAELQEDYRGIVNEGNIASTVFAPSPDIMERLGLYTAERGIVRDKINNDIVAITRSINGEKCHCFLIRRSALNTYLAKSGKCMFYCLAGEKNLISSSNNQTLERQKLTGAALYNVDASADMIQPLRHEPKEKPRENIDEEGEYGLGIPIEKWVSMSQKTSSEDFNELKKLAELAKQEEKDNNDTK